MSIDTQIAELTTATTALTQTVLAERTAMNAAVALAGTTPGPRGAAGADGAQGVQGTPGIPGSIGLTGADGVPLTAALGLATATGVVSTDTGPSPLAGQILTASSPGTASWQYPVEMGMVSYESMLAGNAVYAQSASATSIAGLAVTINEPGTYRAVCSVQFACIPGLVAAQCTADLTALIAQINALPSALTHAAAYGNGEVMAPGLYSTTGASTHTGNIVFDAGGNPDAMFIIRCGAAHAVAAAATSTLRNGAQACNVFWSIVGAPTIGAGCDLKGTYIGQSAIAPGDVFTLEGRILTMTGAVTTSNTTYSVPLGTTALNLGILKSFVFFTPAGAISNTVVTGGSGDVATGGGAITGFGMIKGVVYLPTDVNSKIAFEFYKNGLPVPTTLRYSESRVYAPSQIINLAGTITVSAGQMVSVSVKVLLGSVSMAQGNLFLMKIA
jgi:hypothetical protein